MDLPRARLEDWMRDRYFQAEYDIGSSGVASYCLGDLLDVSGVSAESLCDMQFDDGQTLGSDQLRQAIARRLSNGDSRRVMPTHGSSEAIFLVIRTLLKPCDHAIVLDPCYQQLASTAEACGSETSRWPLRFSNDFMPDFDELGQLIRRNTKLLIVNFPHNPTGATITESQQQELLRIVEHHGIYLLWDAAFAELTYGQRPLPDPSIQYDRAITLGTLSKAYGLPGLRVGWCIANPELLVRFAQLRDYLTLFLSPLVEYLASLAVENGDELINRRRHCAMANLSLLSRWMDEREELIGWVKPKGGVTSFPRIKRYTDVEQLCSRLTDEYRVLLVPGSCFGHARHVRLGFGGSRNDLVQGLERLELVVGGSE